MRLYCFQNFFFHENLHCCNGRRHYVICSRRKCYVMCGHNIIVANLFLFCYERDFMLSLSDNNQTILLKLLTQPPDI